MTSDNFFADPLVLVSGLSSDRSKVTYCHVSGPCEILPPCIIFTYTLWAEYCCIIQMRKLNLWKVKNLAVYKFAGVGRYNPNNVRLIPYYLTSIPQSLCFFLYNRLSLQKVEKKGRNKESIFSKYLP